MKIARQKYTANCCRKERDRGNTFYFRESYQRYSPKHVARWLQFVSVKECRSVASPAALHPAMAITAMNPGVASRWNNEESRNSTHQCIKLMDETVITVAR
jgi:hypothetical protein